MTRTTAVIATLIAAPAALAVTNGFSEDFNNGLNGWGSGGGLGGTVSSIDTPGADGANDAFLYVNALNSASSQLATRVIGTPDFTGDFAAAGITAITFDLIDPGNDENAVIRVGIGVRQQNFWVSNRNWDPNNTFQTFAVDLTNPAEWT